MEKYFNLNGEDKYDSYFNYPDSPKESSIKREKSTFNNKRKLK